MASVVGNARRAFLTNFLLCVMLLCTTWLSATVRLAITDMDGTEIEHAGVSQLFGVVVETDARGDCSLSKIEGLENFHRVGTLSNSRITSAGRVACNGYIMRVDEPGSYSVGPAHVYINGREEIVAAIQLEVKQEARTAGAADRKNHNKPFARLTVSQSEVFVREPVTCTLRFYYSRAQVRNVQGQSVDVKDTVIIDRQNSQQGSETIDGKTWNYIEWSWRLLSKKEGSLTLPACLINFEELQSGGFLFPTMQSKHLYSNAVLLEVHALPLCDEPIQAVGLFERLEARVDQPVARAGDALVLTLRIEGSGFFDDEHPVALQEMPDALKWYESKNYDLSPERDGTAGKACEFVVQGLHEGEWQIPVQHIVYFDTAARECRTLASTPLQITITPGQAVMGMVPNIPTTCVGQAADELSPLIAGDGLSWWAHEQRALPWWLVLVLIVVPSVIVASALIRRRLLQTPLVRKKTLFSSARTELLVLTQRGEVNNLHALFTRLFARLYDDPAIDLMSENLQRRLRDAGLKPETLERWQQFADRCAEAAFYTIDSESMSKESLFLVADQWLIFFKERL
jgi:hypothetical protein